MDSILPNSFDIFQIYRQYCDIMSGLHATGNEDCGPNDESHKVSFSREAVAQLLEVVESKVGTRISILEEAYKLMSRLDLMADFSEFSRFYDFVFFICRENGQKNITVSGAVMAWRLVLAGRFRLLNQWCNFVERNQRHNISEDTWRQVLAFSRCVHENLEGYDPEGAWPVLIDDFVEHMYRIRGFVDIPKISCNCGVSEPQPSDDSHSAGLENFPGSKRKSCDNMQMEQESSEGYANPKRRHVSVEKTVKWGQNQLGCAKDNCNEIGKHNNSSFGCTKSLNTIEGCLSKGFARLLSGHSCLQFDQDRRVSYT